MKMPKIHRIRFAIGLDVSPMNGDLAALAIGLNEAQYASTLRANIPTGDSEGAKILAEIDSIKTEFLKSNPRGVCSVFVISDPKLSELLSGIAVDAAE